MRLLSASLGAPQSICRLLAALLAVGLIPSATAETAPASSAQNESKAAIVTAWGESGSAPQTGSSAHTSGAAFRALNGKPGIAAPEAPVESAAPSTPSAHDTQATENAVSKILVVIDKPTQEMKVYVDNIERYTWQVSTGLASYDTPSGTYIASSMNEIWYSKEWDNAPMPHAIFFTKRGHAIHGTDETKKLGMPASHGCVRLSPDNARTLFLVVEESGLENTEIVLNGNIPRAKTRVASPEPRKQYIKSKKKSAKTAVKKAKPSAKKVATPSAAKAEAARPGARKQQVKVPEALVERVEKPRRLRRKERLRLYYSERARTLTPPR